MPSLRRVGLLSVSCVLACEHDLQEPQGSHLEYSRTPAQGEPRDIDAWFRLISVEVPEFAGFYYDSAGVPSVALTDIKRGIAAANAVSSHIERDGYQADDVRVVVASYDFPTLDRWRNVLAAPLFRSSDQVITIDVAESRNRIVIGAENPGAVPLGNLLSALTIPEAAVILEHRPAAVATQGPGTLDDPFPAKQAGIRIESGFTGEHCTLSFNFTTSYSNKPYGFGTASHCTEFSVNDDYPAHQPISENVIGTETRDTYSSPWCNPLPAPCRKSDFSYFLYDPGIEVEVGVIAKPNGVGQWQGSIDIDQNSPRLFITDHSWFQAEGLGVNKIGQTTGWTFGTIAETCVHISQHPSFPSYGMHCQTRVIAGADEGDSGAPVFYFTGTNQVTLSGVAWGTLLGSYYWYSPMGNINTEMTQEWVALTYQSGGALTVSINGPDEVQPYVSCYYQASASGGVDPYTYSWYKNETFLGTGSGMVVEAPGGGEFTIRVEAADSETNSGSLIRDVLVSPQAPPCFQ